MWFKPHVQTFLHSLVISAWLTASGVRKSEEVRVGLLHSFHVEEVQVMCEGCASVDACSLVGHMKIWQGAPTYGAPPVCQMLSEARGKIAHILKDRVSFLPGSWKYKRNGRREQPLLEDLWYRCNACTVLFNPQSGPTQQSQFSDEETETHWSNRLSQDHTGG